MKRKDVDELSYPGLTGRKEESIINQDNWTNEIE